MPTKATTIQLALSFDAVPFGYCHCGCGQLAPRAKQNRRDRGDVKGEPVRYILGHNAMRHDAPYVVDKSTGCWVWQWVRNATGYGIINRGGTILAHRYVYESVRGPIPFGLQLDHLCRNHACVNPDHLEPVTNAENQHRGIRSRINWDIAREMRRLRAEGMKVRLIADRFGVSESCAAQVVTFRTWRE